MQEREISTDVPEGTGLSESEANGQKFGKRRRELEAPCREPRRKVKRREARVHELEAAIPARVGRGCPGTSELPAGSRRGAAGRRAVSSAKETGVRPRAPAGASSSPEPQVSAIHLPGTFCEGLLRALHHQDEKVTTQTDLMCSKCLRKRAIPSICDRACQRNTENEKRENHPLRKVKSCLGET